MQNEERTEVVVAPEYEVSHYWAILPVNGNGAPTIRKTDPGRLNIGEIALHLEVRVPKRARRVVQTIAITLPEDSAHVAKIDVSIPDLSS